MHAENPYEAARNFFFAKRKDPHRGGEGLNAAGCPSISPIDISKTGGKSFVFHQRVPNGAKEPEVAPSLREEQEDLSLLLREASMFPKYDVGLVIEHQRHGYRGVVLAYDKSCKAEEEWTEAFNVDSLTRGRHQPFYTVLVDTRDRGPRPHVTYVAEENILISQRKDAVLHPLVLRLFNTCSEREPAPHYPPDIDFDLRYEPGAELEVLLQHLASQRQGSSSHSSS